MNKRNITILFIASDVNLGGSTASLLNLIRSLRKEIEPMVLFPAEGLGVDLFRHNGIECIVHKHINYISLRSNSIFKNWKHPWRWHYIKRFRFAIGCLWSVWKVLNGRKIDIIHTNTSVNGIGVFLAKVFNAKHVWHVREFIDLDFHQEVYMGFPYLRNLLNQADARIAVSNAIKEHWQLKDENTWVIGNAVRCKDDAISSFDKEKFVLFCSYNINKVKGAEFTIEAFAESRISSLGCRLVMIGHCDETYKEYLLMIAEQLRIREQICIIPCQTDVKPWFSKASAFIMASENEAFGRVTAEAMFYGCPVIARATGGSLDIVQHGETGWLFRDIKECAELISKVCDNKQNSIIVKAQEYALNNFSEEVYAQKILNIYHKLIEEEV